MHAADLETVFTYAALALVVAGGGYLAAWALDKLDEIFKGEDWWV